MNINKFLLCFLLFSVVNISQANAVDYTVNSVISYNNGQLLTTKYDATNLLDIVSLANVYTDDDKLKLQNWKFVSKYIKRTRNLASGKSSSRTVYNIVNEKSNRCLRLSSLHESYLVAGDCDEAIGSQWTYAPLATGAIQIRNIVTGTCLDSFNSKRNDGVLILKLSPCISGPYVNRKQVWSFSGPRGNAILIK